MKPTTKTIISLLITGTMIIAAGWTYAQTTVIIDRDTAREWATARGIISPLDEDTWTKPITREHLAVILMRYHCETTPNAPECQPTTPNTTSTTSATTTAPWTPKIRYTVNYYAVNYGEVVWEIMNRPATTTLLEFTCTMHLSQLGGNQDENGQPKKYREEDCGSDNLILRSWLSWYKHVDIPQGWTVESVEIKCRPVCQVEQDSDWKP